ncbi:MAG TPA: hypothetical protein VIO38_02760 [Rariglobus sp.]
MSAEFGRVSHLASTMCTPQDRSRCNGGMVVAVVLAPTAQKDKAKKKEDADLPLCFLSASSPHKACRKKSERKRAHEERQWARIT